MHQPPFIWQITGSPYPSPFLSETRVFGRDNPVFLIDQYSGKRPALLNAEFIQTGKLQFEVYASALLDSNLANQIHATAKAGGARDGFRELFNFLTENRWDFSLYFYYMEHYSKSSRGDFLSNAISRTRALLTLQSMDDKRFLEAGEIVSNPEAVEHYLQSHAVTSLDEVAECRVHEFCANFSRVDALEHVEVIEISLAKMVLLRRFEMPRAAPADQFKAFVKFLDEDLDARVAREAHLALHYFYDKAGRLLGIQPNTPGLRALQILRSTAWDMYFVRIPELLLSRNPQQLCLSYIATQERQLYQLAKLFSVESVHGYGDGATMPIVGYSLKDLPETFRDVEFPERVPNTTRRAVPVGLRDALFGELLRRLPA